MTYIYTCMHPFYVLHLSLSLMKKTIPHKVIVRTIDYLYVPINQYPQHVLFFYIISYLCVMHLFSIRGSKIVFKSCVDFDFISRIIQRFVIKSSVYKTPVIIWPCHILYSEN